MGVFGRTPLFGRRRRPNPLRRRSDVVEAWTGLAVAVLLFVGAPLTGAFAARWAYDEGRATATAQRAERHHVRAVAVAGSGTGAPAAQAGRQYLFPVRVLWTEPGAGARTATARVPAGTRRGDSVDLWLDAHGRAVAAPPGALAVRQYSVAVGIWAAGVTAAAVLFARTALRRAAVQRRLGEWERAWARTEPEWTGRRA
ncbi:hypothetical protein ACOT81_02160 [Streptomyces sp. WI04-05B]|uniref:Rv1733c family protein n=1 Tax=Streptomyces TaxID=1883 RepID=UPI0029B0DDF3|nr:MULTISPECIES: hypothetical protein [unclassified Streptomyces]MDX2541710.1 hypothetical protein [Streptomyces sp. WI04-05B]MDX2583556.1 hypothetical protein [Streptomyces sp. WI04-05A]MDX3745334.1 hypothetical protein [Streptomyces sp. AK08-02]